MGRRETETNKTDRKTDRQQRREDKRERIELIWRNFSDWWVSSNISINNIRWVDNKSLNLNIKFMINA